MTIRVTETGKAIFMKALTDKVDSLHLFTVDGELSGNGYASKKLDPQLWDRGVYPDQTWTLEAGERQEVLGYFAMDTNGQILFEETFSEPSTIQHRGDEITVGVRLLLISQG